MRVLVHICCGPCSITVLQRLMNAGYEPVGLFFNPNIHPLAEYMRRREGVLQVAERLGVELILADELAPEDQEWSALGIKPCASPANASEPGRIEGAFSSLPPDYLDYHVTLPVLPPAADSLAWFRAVSGNEDRRCLFCWSSRLEKTSQLAAKYGCQGFTTSLLYSRYQAHGHIKAVCESLAHESLEFIYEDFRTSWQLGIDLSKEWGIYRQQYCGCLYSEYERYARPFRKICGMQAK